MDVETWLRLVRARIPFDRKLDYLNRQGAIYSLVPMSRADGNAMHSQPVDEGVKADLGWLALDGAFLLTLADPDYPPLLREIAKPPLALFGCGNRSLLASPQVAMVGSRNPTPVGREQAHQLAGHLVQAGITVTSGLARGIDREAHLGALDEGGPTIAVFATGPDQVYPRSNAGLANRIIEQGGLWLTEFPVGEIPHARNFPRRNRIISGLSLGTLVVEAALKSGSLITARNALEQGREVFAIPGSILNPLSKGCHHLIRQGAKLVEGIEDIVEELTWFGSQVDAGADRSAQGQNHTAELITELSCEQKKVLESMGFDPVDINVLAERMGWPAEKLAVQLFELELSGLVCKSAGFFTRRR